ncbi:MAG: MBL fold metallo-hydrolase [Lachnospiraceae bacterium]|nr:MBL fold metallo-hydrolase [Lachnospiraceae bacterium]
MIYLILAIVSSALISVCMRIGEKHVTNQMGMFMSNYAVCILFALLYLGANSDAGTAIFQLTGSAILMGAICGTLYLANFALLKFNMKSNGVVLSSTFMKLGVLIPTLMAIVVFREVPTLLQIGGILLAVISIVMIHFEKDAAGEGKSKLWLLIMLLVSGITDSMANVFEKLGVSEAKDGYLLITFFTAFLISLVLMLRSKSGVSKKDILFGIMLSIPNYYSARFLLLALTELPAVLVYPVCSVGTIVVITVVGILFFKEKLSAKKISALIMIMAALALLNCKTPAGTPENIEAEVTVTVTPTVTPIPTVNKDLGAEFYVTYIDVGQGDSALVYCDGQYMLIDGGELSYSSLISAFLERNEIPYLDIVVGTHAHSDHIGGLVGALMYAKAGLVLCPVTWYDSPAFRSFSYYAGKNGPGITVPNKMDTYELGSATVTVLGLNVESEDINDTSIVLRVTYGDRAFLFTGDAERPAEQVLLEECPELLDSDVLKVGHHGSNSSTTYPFLREIMPEYAIICCGAGNKHGHPTSFVLGRLRDAGAAVYRTDIHGDITIYYDGEEWAIITQKGDSTE